jgi:hypothetical protein
VHNKNLHTHSRHKRVLVKIKKDIEHRRLPATRDLKTLDSYTRVTTNKRYLRQLERLIEEVTEEVLQGGKVQEETSCH